MGGLKTVGVQIDTPRHLWQTIYRHAQCTPVATPHPKFYLTHSTKTEARYISRTTAAVVPIIQARAAHRANGAVQRTHPTTN